ncbi:MAG: hypothetical protein QY309_07975 [Cyclobacteriaceae bacterium]|nr:MAG: hypothetical protein QY309_07975 [Cyclobacteriaceae bacterium]
MLKELAQPYNETELDAFTVRRLRGKEAIGNKPEAQQPFTYVEQGSLF